MFPNPPVDHHHGHQCHLANDNDDKMDVDTEWDISLYWFLFTRREMESDGDAMDADVIGRGALTPGRLGR